MFALFFRRCAPCESLLPREWLRGDASRDRNQIVSSVRVHWILEQPFAGPGTAETLPASSFRNFPGFAACRRHEAVRSQEIAKGASDLCEDRHCGSLSMKGNASDSFNSSIRESKGLSLGRRSSDIRGKRRSPPLGYGFLLRASFPARCENAWLLARCPESCRCSAAPRQSGPALRGGLINPYPAVTSTNSPPSRTCLALSRSRSPSQAATTTVATQLPIRLPSARAMPMNQSTDSTSTSPIAGMLGTAFKVAARMTIAEPGTPCAPFDVIRDTPSTRSRSPNDSGVLVACAMNTTASVR